jgi:hypothetical protein
MALVPPRDRASWCKEVMNALNSFQGGRAAGFLQEEVVPAEVWNGLLSPFKEEAVLSNSALLGSSGGSSGSTSSLLHADYQPAALGKALAAGGEAMHNQLFSLRASKPVIQPMSSRAGGGSSNRSSTGQGLGGTLPEDQLSQILNATSASMSAIALRRRAIDVHKVLTKHRESKKGAANGDSTVPADGPSDPGTEALQGLIDGLLRQSFRILLYAVEQFQLQHMTNRSWIPLAMTPNKGWDTPLLVQLVRVVVKEANSTLRKEPLDDEFVGELNRTWRKLFVFLQSADLEEEHQNSRRRATLVVVNGLLGVLMSAGNTILSTKLLHSVEHGEKVAAETGNISSSVLESGRRMRSELGKYYFFRGRMHLSDGHYVTAFQSFACSWRSIGSDKSGFEKANQSRLLFYWFSAAVALGLQIPENLQDVDPFVTGLFAPIFTAMSQGDVIRFVEAVDAHAILFRRYGVYLAIMSARKLVYLYLLKRVQEELTAAKRDGTATGIDDVDPSKIPVQLVVQCLIELTPADRGHFPPTLAMARLASSDEGAGAKHGGGASPSKKPKVEYSPTLNPAADLIVSDPVAYRQLLTDSVCLWLARLIGEGKLKAYISYEHQVIVMSTKGPFPPPNIQPPPPAPVATPTTSGPTPGRR